MDKIEEFRKLLNQYSNKEFQVIQGEILSETPVYPYIEMFTLNITPDFHNQNETIVEKISEDGKNYLIEENEKAIFSSVQLNCRHKSMIEAQELAQKLFMLINYTKRDDLLNNEIGIRNMSMIRSLNFFEAGKWSYCYTFDVELTYSVIETKQVETIEKIKINNEIIEEE